MLFVVRDNSESSKCSKYTAASRFVKPTLDQIQRDNIHHTVLPTLILSLGADMKFRRPIDLMDPRLRLPTVNR